MTKKTRILIVEDEIIIATDIKYILEEYGYEVLSLETTGEGAIKRATIEKLDLILMDIHLPGEINGIEAAKAINKKHSIPTIFITAFADKNIILQAKEAKSFGYLIKPISEAQLKAEVEIVLYRAEMEKKLIESENKFRTLFDDATSMIHIVGRDGIIKNVNKAELKRLGYKRKELIGEKFIKIMHPSEHKRAKAIVKNILTLKVTNFEMTLITKSGESVIVEVFPSPQYEDGKITHIRAILNDITEKKKAEYILKQNKEFESFILVLATNFINITTERISDEISNTLLKIGKLLNIDRNYLFLMSEDGKYITNTHEWCCKGIEPQIENLQNIPTSMFPWWMEKLKNKEVFAIEDVSKLPIEAIAEKENFEAQGIKSLIIIPMFRNNELFGFIGLDSVRGLKSWNIRNISLLKILSEIFVNALLRLQTEKLLRENENKFRTLYESTNDAVMILYKDSFTDCNSAALKLFGYFDKEEFLKHHPSELSPNKQPDGSDSIIFFNRKIINTFVESSTRFEWYHKKADGTIFPAEVLLTKMTLNNKEVIQAVIRDISERKRDEKILKRKLLVLSQPEIGIEGVSLSNIIDLSILQKIQDQFAKSFNIGSIIFDKNLKVITKQSFELDFCSICNSTKKGKKECNISESQLLEIFDNGKNSKVTCPSFNEIVSLAVPIVISNKVVGIWQMGKSLIKEIPKNKIIKRANEIGVEPKDFLTAYYKLKLISEKEFVNITNLLEAVSKNISLLGLQNLQQARDISKRIRAEEKLLESEEKYSALLKSQTDIIFEIDNNSKFVFINPISEKIIGKPIDEIFATPFYQLFHKKSRISIYKEYKNTLEKFKKNKDSVNDIQELELVLLNEKILHIRTMPLIDKNGKIIGIRGIARDVTERVISQNIINENEEKFRILFEESDDAILVIDNNKFVDCNQSVLKMLGYSKKEDILNLHPSQLSPEKQHDGELSFKKAERILEHVAIEGSSHFEWIHKRANGEEFPVEVWLTAIPYQGRKIIHTVWRDITEQKNIELELNQYRYHLEKLVAKRTKELTHYQEKLEDMVEERTLQFQQSEERYRVITENSIDTIMRFDREFRHLYVNSIVEESTGIKAEEYIGKTHEELGFPDYLCKLWHKSMEKVFTTKEKNRVEFQLPNGIWIDWLLVPELNINGDVESVLTSGRDITEAHILADALNETMERYQILFNSGSDAVFVHQRLPNGKPTKFIEVNNVACNMLGYTKKELLNKASKYISHIDNKKYIDITNKLTEFGHVSFESTHLAKDGRKIDFEINSRLFILKGIPTILSIARDITERKKTEEEKERLLRETLKLVAMKSNFISTVSHEFRTPLSTIFTSTELLEVYHTKWGKEKKEKHFNRIKQGVNNLTELLNDVTVLEKSDLGRVVLKLKKMDLIELTKKLIAEAKGNYDNMRHNILFNANRKTMPVLMDEKLFRQIVLNLLTNAIKYTPNNKSIYVKIHADKEYIIISVIDEGIGIPVNDQKNIFKQFIRGSNVSTIGGTGMGLAILEKAVNKFNGIIKMKSSEGEGTHFTVKLPKIITSGNK